MNAGPHRSDHLTTPALEGRVAGRIAGMLAEQAERVPHDVAERLRVAREQAVERARRARQARPVAAAAPSLVGVAHGAALLGAPLPWWQRAVSVLPLLVLLFGLTAVDRVAEREQVLAAAEVDTMLLTADVPPAAYADPGFGEFLRSAPP
jgi:Protein of unknown function (DUF3619)